MTDDQISVEVSDALDWLHIRDGDHRWKTAVREVEEIVSKYAEEEKADFSRQRINTESLSRIIEATKSLDRALASMDDGAFIDLFGNDEAPLNEQDYDLIRDYLSRLQAGLSKIPKKLDGGGKPEDHAKHWLVIRCFDIFETYRPGIASTTDGGPFHTFVSIVYELATRERGVDFGRHIRSIFHAISD